MAAYKVRKFQEHYIAGTYLLFKNYIGTQYWMVYVIFMYKNDFFCSRSLCTTKLDKSPSKSNDLLLSEEEMKDFMSVFPDILNIASDCVDVAIDIPDFSKWYKNLLNYTVPNGTKMVAQILIAFYKALEKPENLTPENIRLAHILGWCSQLVSYLKN